MTSNSELSAMGASSHGERGAAWRDIRDFGAVPGFSAANAAATRAAIQAAMESFDPPAPTWHGARTIYVAGVSPSRPWCIDGPLIFDRSSITLQGDSRVSSII